MWEYAESVLNSFPEEIKNDLEEITTSTSTVGGYKHEPIGSFCVSINAEMLEIPYRIYFDIVDSYDSLTVLQKQIVDCIFTRHYNGYVREDNLKKIILINEPWVVPYVIRLLGEYVIEIIHVIDTHLPKLDMAMYSAFINENPDFYQKTQAQVISYWDCYYRRAFNEKSNYVGFKVIEAFNKSI